MQEASGLRQTTCPWQALRDPFTVEVLRAHRWWRKGQLGVRWPTLPHALERGLDHYDAALNAVEHHDFEKRRKRHEDEAARREQAAVTGWHPTPSRPIPRRGR